MKFFKFIELIQSKENIIQYLIDQKVIKSSLECNNCRKTMCMQDYTDSIDGKCFRCTKCKSRKSIRTNTFIESFKQPLSTIACMIYFMHLEILQKHIAEILDIDPKTVMDFQAIMREEMGKFLFDHGEMLGGDGIIVQVDESVVAKAKISRNKHARPVREQWVFGAYDVNKKHGWIQLVGDRFKETLHSIIKEWCLPGTIIASDGWPAYEGLAELGFEHRVVVHERHFVDPKTGVHTNNVESYWQRCKRSLKRVYGTSRDLLPTYIDEFMWIERYGTCIKDRWDRFIETIMINYQ